MAVAGAGSVEPEAGLCRSRIYQAISEARASLADPSRPFTPADPSRKLFRQPSVGDTLSHPTSALSISEARASLAEPSRPFTPADPSRRLFQRCQISAGELSRPTSSASDSLSRPTSSFSVGSAAFSGEPVPPPKRIDGAEVFSVNDSDETEPHQASWWASVERSLCELHPSAPLETLLRACDRLWDALRECGVAGPPMGGATVPAAELGRRSRRLVGGATSLMDRKVRVRVGVRVRVRVS